MATIDDVAKMAGASKSSVSRVLNGNYTHMSEAMRRKIEQAIEELNYRPNSIAQSLKKKETRVIGLVVGDLNPFWTDALKGVQDECSRHGYGLMVSTSNWDTDKEVANIQMQRSKQVDGMIIATLMTGLTDIYEQLTAENYPFVFADSTTDEVIVDKVVTNTIAGAMEAVEYLIGLGHRRIAAVLFPIETASVRKERLTGYLKALEKHGIPRDDSLIQICRTVKGSGVEATVQLLSTPDRPTAIFSTNIHLTLEVLKGIRQLGLDVPNDISVVGHDDTEWAPLLDPPLTTVAVPAYEMGSKAAAMLIRKIQSGKPAKPKKIEVMPKLMIRQSAREYRPPE